MIKQKTRKDKSSKIHRRIRVKLSGTAEKPRLAVHRSNKHIYAQIIDDTRAVTMVASATIEPSLEISNGGNIAAAKEVGRILAERARSAGIESVVFDRGGFLYHGRIAALADSAREAGLQF